MKMAEYRSYAGLSSKWMGTGILLACQEKDEYRSYAVLSKKMDAVLSDAILS